MSHKAGQNDLLKSAFPKQKNIAVTLHYLTFIAIHWITISTPGYQSWKPTVLTLTIANLDKSIPYGLASLGNATAPYASTVDTLIPAEVHTLFHKIASQRCIVHNAKQIHLQ